MNFVKFLRTPFYRTRPDDSFCKIEAEQIRLTDEVGKEVEKLKENQGLSTKDMCKRTCELMAMIDI